MNKEKFCQSCGMPLKVESEKGTNKDGSVNEDYCTYCFQDGDFTMKCSMGEMVEHNLQFLGEFNRDAGTNFDENSAREEMLKFFPTLKRWNR